MELNGVANLKLILEQLKSIRNSPEDLDESFDLLTSKMDKQLEYLQRYMNALAHGKTPYWHEVIANCDKFPLRGK